MKPQVKKNVPITGGECYDNTCRFITTDEPICTFEGFNCIKNNRYLFQGLENAYKRTNK